VLREAARLRHEGLLKQANFERKLARLAKEELIPLGVRDLADGTTRFLIKESESGRAYEMIDCDRNNPTPAGVSYQTHGGSNCRHREHAKRARRIREYFRRGMTYHFMCK
jgi:hypothetical protein